jgi:hypothetical protein
MGPETKIDCAGENQQQFNDRQKTLVKRYMFPRAVSKKTMVVSPAGFGTKNDCAGETSSNLPTDRRH